MRETRLSGSEGGGARTRSPYPYRRWAFRARPLGVASRQKRMCSPGGRAGFQPAGSRATHPAPSFWKDEEIEHQRAAGSRSNRQAGTPALRRWAFGAKPLGVASRQKGMCGPGGRRIGDRSGADCRSLSSGGGGGAGRGVESRFYWIFPLPIPLPLVPRRERATDARRSNV